MFVHADKSQPLSPRHRFMIALRWPCGVVETGLRICLPEKSPDGERAGCRAVRSLQSDLFGDYREYRHVSRVSTEEPQIFSAVQTAWRREWDSNPRYPFE